ncbi:MAG: flagellar biosynthesis protein FlhA [Phycisphaerales bacterium]|nr:MAG: flagellar biosynthesis protein FlhA [Phycisphaerales bacterium]
MADSKDKPATGGGGFALPSWVHAIGKQRGLIVPIGFVSLLVVLLVPLPPAIMDALIAFNISLGVIVLLTTIYMSKPLEFSVFPSLLLATTLLRLVLNVASTRLILTADASSPQEAMGVAGKVISAFGNFVAGDSLFVGIVIFSIMVIIQFLVITKGATRVSEVAARFTLDAMPGKQMAIDSDLNAGIINEQEARDRREEIRREADFFGSMDGASKFVRGDAVAGIIITLVNIMGGFAVGAMEKGWPAAQTADVFTRLTIGDGLASQIPSFIISIAAALIVTRSGSKAQLGEEMTAQVMSQPTGLAITSGFLVLLAVTPLPTVPLLVTGVGLGLISFTMQRTRRRSTREAAEEVATAGAAEAGQPPPVETLLKVDLLELEVGYGLVGLVEKGGGAGLLDRISATRRQMAIELGFVMPPVRIRDNMQLGSNQYSLKIRGNPVAGGTVRPDHLLAMDSGLASGRIEGETTKEPAFGLDAVWISPSLQPRAETMNYTVVDPASVIATHASEVVKRHADELLTREEVANLVEGLKERAPRLVEEAIPAVIKRADLQKVLQNLLRERVPIRDLETIVETLTEWGPKTSDLEVLTEYVRNALRRSICASYTSDTGDGVPRLICVTLDPGLEDLIAGYIDRGPAGTTVNMPARVATAVARQIGEGLQRVTEAGALPVVIASPQVRATVRQVLEPHVPGVAVLGYNEVEPGVEVQSMALIMSPALTAGAVGAAGAA